MVLCTGMYHVAMWLGITLCGRYSCDGGARMVGEPVVYCDGGVWNGTKPQCEGMLYGSHYTKHILIFQLLLSCHHCPYMLMVSILLTQALTLDRVSP